jgi:predicted GH43/DUF377 family glycosyl hydrolase/tetratricopeptide (TPR) repeat protein
MWSAEDGTPGLRAAGELAVVEALNGMQRFDEARAALRAAEAFAARGDALSRASVLILAGIETADNPDFARHDLARRAVELIRPLLEPTVHPTVLEFRREMLFRALTAVAIAAMRAGEYPVATRALDEADRAFADSTSLDYPERAVVLAQLRGEVLAEEGRWSEAAPHLEAAVRQARALHSAVREAAARGWLGLALCHRGEEERGVAELRAALAVERDDLDSVEGAGKWLFQLGEYLAGRRRYPAAAEVLWLAEPLFDELGHARLGEVRDLLDRVRREWGGAAYARARAAFRPAESRWAVLGRHWGLGPFTKFAGNPVLGPRARPVRGPAVFNPAAWADGSGVTLLCRVVRQDAPLDAHGNPPPSIITAVTSADGRTFPGAPGQPVLVPSETWELPGGCEDPRLAHTGGRFVLTYTAYDGEVARVALAVGDDLRQWRRRGLVFADDDWLNWFPTEEFPDTPPGWTKSAVMLPEQVDGRWWMYFGDTHIWAAWTKDPELGGWRVVRRPVLSPRPGRFDSRLVEPGPAPVRTDDGLVFLYNGADRELRYAVGQALISPADPTRVLRRCGRPILTVTDRAEREGTVPQVVFATGLVRFDGAWLLYYGMGDASVGLAEAPA